MVQFLDFSKLDLFATRVSGKITKEDFKTLKAELLKRFNSYDKISWYYEMVNFKGWELNTFFEDIKFSMKSKQKFNRVAIVGDKYIEDLMAKFYKIISPAEVKYFDLQDKEAAFDWIKYNIKRVDSN
jgi:hypothetical protein